MSKPKSTVLNYLQAKQKRYQGGGFAWKNPQMGAGIGLGASLGSSLVDVIDPQNEYGAQSTGGAVASGALKGAATGAALGPIGAGVGALVGGVTSWLGNNKAKEAQETAETRKKSLDWSKALQDSQTILASYDNAGTGIRSLKDGGILRSTPGLYVKPGKLKSMATYQVGGEHNQMGPFPAKPVKLPDPRPKLDLSEFMIAERDAKKQAEDMLYSRAARTPDYNYDDPNKTLILKQGKFRGTKLPKALIDDAWTAAEKEGLKDPYKFLGMIGQESTFGGGGAEESKARRVSKQHLVSGWNLQEKFQPREFMAHLADNKVPGVTVEKGFHGYKYGINNAADSAAVQQYLQKNPKALQGYKDRIAKQAQSLPKDFDYFREAAKFIKQDKLQQYNPGDDKYLDSVDNSTELLRQDPVLTEYLKAKRQVDNSTMLNSKLESKFQKGGFDSFTDPPTVKADATRLDTSFAEKMLLNAKKREVLEKVKTLRSVDSLDKISTLPSKLVLETPKTKEEILQYQALLKAEGFDLGEYGKNKDGIDGIWGKKSKAAADSYNNSIDPLQFTPLAKQPGQNCKETQCSEYAANELYRISNVNKSKVSNDEFNVKLGLGVDAWKLSDVILEKGGQKIYDVNDDIDRSSIKRKVGDIVSINTAGASEYQEKANTVGDGYTHSGFISKVYSDGSYDVTHNVHKGSRAEGFEGKEYVSRVTNNRLVDFSHKGMPYKVGKITRPNYEAVKGKNIAVDEDINIESKIKNPTINSLVKYANSSKKEISKFLNLDNEEYNNFAEAALSIIQQESKGGQTTIAGFSLGALPLHAKETMSSAAEFLANKVAAPVLKTLPNSVQNMEIPVVGGTVRSNQQKLENIEASKSIARIKYNTNFTEGEQQQFKNQTNSKSESSPKAAFLATMKLLADTYNTFIRKGIDKEEALYRAIASHNNPNIGYNLKEDSFASQRKSDYANKVLEHSQQFTHNKNGKHVASGLDRLAADFKVVAESVDVRSLYNKLKSEVKQLN